MRSAAENQNLRKKHRHTHTHKYRNSSHGLHKNEALESSVRILIYNVKRMLLTYTHAHTADLKIALQSCCCCLFVVFFQGNKHLEEGTPLHTLSLLSENARHRRILPVEIKSRKLTAE